VFDEKSGPVTHFFFGFKIRRRKISATGKPKLQVWYETFLGIFSCTWNATIQRYPQLPATHG